MKEAIDGRQDPHRGLARSPTCPTTPCPSTAKPRQKLLKLIDALEDNDDVQTVSHNAEIPESVSV